MIIGSHVSYNAKEGLLGSVKEALSYKANSFMFYTGAPQNTKRNPIDKNLTNQAFIEMEKNGIDKNNVIVHAPYIINLANKEKEEFSIQFLKQEIKRVEELGFNKLVLHPGSHVGVGTKEGIKQIIHALNNVITKEQSVVILIETMAGKGSECGKTFDEIKEIIDNVKFPDKIGVCMDTCHIHDAGYDISNFDDILTEFDKKIGLYKLQCIHINDSKNDINTHKDRHENIGFGKIGFDNLLKVINHEKLKSVPKILETPYIGLEDDSKERLFPPYKFEIEMIKNKKWDSNLYKKIREYYK